MIIDFCDTTHHHLRLHHFSVLLKCLHRGNTDEKSSQDYWAIGKTWNYGSPVQNLQMCFLTHKKNFIAVIILYISIRCYNVYVYGSISVRWIVHTLMLNRTYKRQSLCGVFAQSSVLQPSILLQQQLLVVNVNLDVVR